MSKTRYFGVFRPTGATVHTNQGEIWCGLAYHMFTMACYIFTLNGKGAVGIAILPVLQRLGDAYTVSG